MFNRHYGAFAYITGAVINLTSIKGINYVNIDFQDGSHISPGTWSKEEYNEYKEVEVTTKAVFYSPAEE